MLFKGTIMKVKSMKAKIRVMKIDDYDEVVALWNQIDGFYIRSIDDSKEGIARFLKRNPNTSVVALIDNNIVGSILCGHDGRYGSLYHVCVHKKYRMQGIGREMVSFALEALKREFISTISLIAFSDNKVGNAFWSELGWDMKANVNRYELILNQGNKVIKIKENPNEK